MYPLVLTKRVDVNGRDFFGRKGKISFSPQTKGGFGWLWKTPKAAYPMDTNIVECTTRRLRLCCGWHKLEICEHLLFLRWFGLCNIVIQSTPWPPYHGCPGGFWQEIKPHCRIDDTSEIRIRWHTLRKTAYWEYPSPRNGYTAFTKIEPNDVPKLEVKVKVCYKGVGGYELNFTLPDEEFLERICVVGNQGVPSSLYYLSRIASALGWPHHNTVVWPQNNGEQRTIIQFAFHRAVDLLGALSLLCKDGLLAARVTSVCSGHEADFRVIKEAAGTLCQLKK